MPRPLLLTPEQQRQKVKNAESLLLNSGKTNQKSKTRLNQMQMERVLNKRRSKSYVSAMKRLDAGGRMHNQRQVEELIKLIQEELPEIEVDAFPIGIVAQCFLGAPYQVHTLDVTGGIIEHYETYRPLPGMLEKARHLASSGYYAFIEVYNTALRAVKEDGTVAVLKE